jgi:hypothetical protein
MGKHASREKRREIRYLHAHSALSLVACDPTSEEDIGYNYHSQRNHCHEEDQTE